MSEFHFRTFAKTWRNCINFMAGKDCINGCGIVLAQVQEQNMKRCSGGNTLTKWEGGRGVWKASWPWSSLLWIKERGREADWWSGNQSHTPERHLPSKWVCLAQSMTEGNTQGVWPPCEQGVGFRAEVGWGLMLPSPHQEIWKANFHGFHGHALYLFNEVVTAAVTYSAPAQVLWEDMFLFSTHPLLTM